MKVRATDKYEKLNIKDNELDRIPKQGEEFEISEERFKVLTQTNKFNIVFVFLIFATFYFYTSLLFLDYLYTSFILLSLLFSLLPFLFQ